MAERTCPRCNVLVSPRLKFCRECGARLDDTGEVPAAFEGIEGSGESTVFGGAARRAAEEAGAREADLDGGAGGTGSPTLGLDRPLQAPAGDRTMYSGGAGKAPPPLDEEDDPETGEPAAAREDAGDKTVIGGSLRRPVLEPDEVPPTDTGDPLPSSTATFVGTIPPGAIAAAASGGRSAPPPAPPPSRVAEVAGGAVEEEDEPVSDDVDDTDEGPAPTPLAPTQRPLAASGARAALPPLPPMQPSAPTPRPTVPSPLPSPVVADTAPTRPSAPPGDWALEHWTPTRRKSSMKIEKAEAVVGRDRGDWTFPDDPFLSRRHGRFYFDEGGALMVEDLGTMNGVFVRLRQAWTLEHRDVVHVGRHVLRFELLSNEEEDPRTVEGDPFTQVMGAQGSPPRARLVKRQDEGFTGMPFFLGAKRYVLGRTGGSFRFTKDDRMSREHAAISFRDGVYVLEDLGSQNGTFVRIRGPVALQRGDVLKMGEEYFKLP